MIFCHQLLPVYKLKLLLLLEMLCTCFRPCTIMIVASYPFSWHMLGWIIKENFVNLKNDDD